MFEMDDENQNNDATINPSKNKDSEVNQDESASDENSVSEENTQSTVIMDKNQHDEKVENDEKDHLMTENKVPGVDYCFKIHVVPSQAPTVADDRLEECMKWFRSNSNELQKWENNTWKNVPAEEIFEKDLLQNVVDVEIFTPTDEKPANKEEISNEEKIVKNIEQEVLDEKEDDNYIQSWLEDFQPQSNQSEKVIDKTEEIQIIDDNNDTTLNDTCQQEEGIDNKVKKCSSLDSQLEDCMNWFRSYSFGKDAGNRSSDSETSSESPVEVDKEKEGDKGERIKAFSNQPVGVTVEISFNRHVNVFDPFSNEDRDDVEVAKIANVEDENTLKDSLNEDNNKTGILIKIEDVDETYDGNEDEGDEWPPSPDKSNTVCQNPFDDIVFLDYDSDKGEEWKNVSFLDKPTVEIEKNPFERYKGWFSSFNDEILETTSSEDEKGEGSGEIKLEDLSIEVQHIPENSPHNEHISKTCEPDSLAIGDSDENDTNSCFDDDVMVFDSFQDIRDSIEDIPAVVTEVEINNLIQDGFDDNMEPDSLIDNFGYHDSIENIDSSDDENTNEADIGDIEIFLQTEQEYEDWNQTTLMETSRDNQSVEEEDVDNDVDENEDSSLSDSSCSSEEEEEEYHSSDSNNDITQDALNDAIDYDVIVVNGLSDSDDESDFNDDDTCDSMYTHGTEDDMEERNRFYHEPSTEENPINSDSDNSALSESDESNNELLNSQALIDSKDELEDLDELLEECMDYFRIICTEMSVQNLQNWNYDLDVFDSDVESIEFDHPCTYEEACHQDSDSDSQVSNITRSDKETYVIEKRNDTKSGCNIASPTQLTAAHEECIFADDEIFEECMMLFDKLINQFVMEREEDLRLDELCIEIDPDQSLSPIRNSRKCWADINDATEKNAVESWLIELNHIQMENSFDDDELEGENVQLVNDMNTYSPINLPTEDDNEHFEECMSWFRSIIDNILDSATVAPGASDDSVHVQEFVTKLLEDGYEKLAQQTIDEKAVDSDEDVPELPADEASECSMMINDLPKIDLSFNKKLSEQLDGYTDSFDSDILAFDGKHILPNSTDKKENSIEPSDKAETRYPLIEHPRSVYESDCSEFVSDIEEDVLLGGLKKNEDEITELEALDCVLQECMEYFCRITTKEKPHEDEIDFVIENSDHVNGSVDDALLEESVMNSNKKDETNSCENNDVEVETKQTNMSNVNDLDIKDKTLDSKLAVCIDWLRTNSSEKEYNYERPDFKTNTTADTKDEVEVNEEKETEEEKIPMAQNPGNESNDIIPDEFKGGDAPYGDIDDRLKKCITLLRSISYGLNDVGSDYKNDGTPRLALFNKKDDNAELNQKKSETSSTDLKSDSNIDGEVELDDIKGKCAVKDDEDLFLDCNEYLETTQDNDDNEIDLDEENVNNKATSSIRSNFEEENIKPLEENEEDTILDKRHVLPDSENVLKSIETSVGDVHCDSIVIGETMVDEEIDDKEKNSSDDPNCNDSCMNNDKSGISSENERNEMELFVETSESVQVSVTNQPNEKCKEEPTVNESEITENAEKETGDEKKIVVLIPPVVEMNDCTQTSSSDSDEQNQAGYLDNTPEEVTSESTDSSESNEKENVSSESFYGPNSNANQKEKPGVSFEPDVTRMSFEEARHYFALKCREVEGDFKKEASTSPRSPRQTKPRNDFRYMNNKLQYSFNEKMIEDLREACALIKQRFVHRPLKTIETLIDVLVRRNRVIRRSESSPHERTDSFDPSLESKEKNQSKKIKRRFSMKSLTELRSDKYRKEREMLSTQPSCEFSKLYGPSVEEKVGSEPSFTRKVRFNGLMSNELTTQSQQMQSAFNAKLIQDLHEVYTLIENRSIKRSVKLVKEIISDIEKRNMTIRLIDRSSYEWDTEGGDWIKLIKEIFGDDYCPNKN